MKRYWKRFKRKELWKGSYEYVYHQRYHKRMFVLTRKPVRGPVKSRSIYFSSWEEARKKGWIPVFKA